MRVVISRPVHLLASALLLAGAGCSSNAGPTGAGGNVATAISIVTGDGQSAAPGAALPIALAVLVRDSSGAGVAGVTVHFAVDSGGGSVATSSATTGSDGIASAGKWTLGAGSGGNVVSATVGSLTPVKFHAQAFGAIARTLFDNLSIGGAGGTITYSKSGDALSGLAITVPAGAYPVGTNWSVVADSSVTVHLPAEFTQVGPVLVISNGQGFADSSMSLTMPMNVPLDDAVAPFYFDPATGILEPIPLIARNATSATLATRHFSADLMAIPGTAPTTLRTALHASFGSVHIVWVRLPAAQLAGTFTTGFQPTIDNWEFDNFGDFLAPNGFCEGMSITEMYYYYFVTLDGRPSLYHHFDQSVANRWDNVQGVRFSASVQTDYSDDPNDQLKNLNAAGAANGISTPSLTASWVILTIKLTHNPVLMALRNDKHGHAVVAFKVTNSGGTTTVFFADPNFPTASRGMIFQGTQLQPVTLQINSGAAGEAFTTAFALAVSAEVSLHAIDARWIEFLAKKAGTDRYPATYTFQIYDSLTDDYSDFTATGIGIDTFRTSVPVFNLRLRCPSCPVPAPGFPEPDEQYMNTYRDSGRVLLTANTNNTALVAGANDFTVVGFAQRTASGDPGYFDSRNFTVIYHGVKIIPGALEGRTDTAYTFTATNGALANADTKFTWSFGDRTANANATGDSTITHTFADTGKFVVRVQLRDASGILFGRDSTVVTISSGIQHLWMITSATLSNITPPGGGTGMTKVDTLVTNAITEWTNSITQDPTHTTITAIELLDQHCGGVVVNQVGSTITGTDALGQTDAIALLALSCPDPDDLLSGSFVLGPIGAGPLTGVASLDAPGNGPAGGSIDAVMSGRSLTGTIHFRMEFTTGLADYAVQFTATQVIAPGAPGLRQPPATLLAKRLHSTPARSP